MSSFNWGLASQNGCNELIGDLFTYNHLDAGRVPLFVCHGWERLFRI